MSIGCKDEIDAYYTKQDEMLQAYYEMDEVDAHGGYFPTSTQVNRPA